MHTAISPWIFCGCCFSCSRVRVCPESSLKKTRMDTEAASFLFFCVRLLGCCPDQMCACVCVWWSKLKTIFFDTKKVKMWCKADEMTPNDGSDPRKKTRLLSLLLPSRRKIHDSFLCVRKKADCNRPDELINYEHHPHHSDYQTAVQTTYVGRPTVARSFWQKSLVFKK